MNKCIWEDCDEKVSVSNNPNGFCSIDCWCYGNVGDVEWRGQIKRRLGIL